MILRRLYELPPKDVVRRALKRLRGERGAAADLTEILASPKTRAQRPYDFLTRYETIIDRHYTWPRLDFESMRVIEIGAGPILGFAPLATFLGCSRYVCIEPSYNSALLRSQEITARYFLPMFKDLSALFGDRMDFEEFLLRLRDRVHVESCELLDATLGGAFDIALSNSCLEHIDPVDRSIERLAGVMRPGARFIHLVDFGNHRSKLDPFGEMYSCEPSAYFEKFGHKVNLLRAPDMLRLFRASGFDAALIPYYSFEDFYAEEIIPYWSERYSRDELFLKVAIIAGPISGARD